jgi:hypothetical protein
MMKSSVFLADAMSCAIRHTLDAGTVVEVVLASSDALPRLGIRRQGQPALAATTEYFMRQQFVSKLASVMTATTVIAWMSLGVVPSAQRSDTEGIKETATFLKAGTETSGAVSQSKMQIQKTLGAYNTLVTQPSKDMKGDYKKLLEAAKETDEKVDDARERVGTMEAAGTTYFTGRAQPRSRTSRTQSCGIRRS